jgi:hypothetical protein
MTILLLFPQLLLPSIGRCTITCLAAVAQQLVCHNTSHYNDMLKNFTFLEIENISNM